MAVSLNYRYTLVVVLAVADRNGGHAFFELFEFLKAVSRAFGILLVIVVRSGLHGVDFFFDRIFGNLFFGFSAVNYPKTG